MNRFQKRIASVLAGATLLVNVAMPAFASTTIQISGNGAGSDNGTVVNNTNQTTITQNNNATVTNNVTSTAITGGNDANFNTGGSTAVDTGNAKVTSNVSTSVNSNAANVACCGTQGADVLIQDNGAGSQNIVNPNLSNTVTINQGNTASVYNDVHGTAETGNNDAKLNTGGDVTVTTGNAEVDASVINKANSNSAEVGGGSAVVTPTASFRILGNGAGSDNYITASLANVTTINQNNYAHLDNDVSASAETGGNDANWNTGGDVTVNTGDAKAGADVSNSANFNYASADCGCLLDVLAKIDGNGAGEGKIDTDSTIALSLYNSKIFSQGNNATIGNDLQKVYAKTGYNEANLNDGGSTLGVDPTTVMTGDSTITNGVSTTANMNVVGGVDLPLPEGWPFGSVSTSFDWTAFLAFFGLHIS